MLDIVTLKKLVAKKLNISVEQLENLIKEELDKMVGVKSERLALSLVMKKFGISIKEISEHLESKGVVIKIGDLKIGMRGANILGRIMRIFPMAQKERVFRKILLQDDTGTALVLLFGKSLDKFNQMNLKVGDVILIKRIRVIDIRRNTFIVVAGDFSDIQIPSKTEYKDLINSCPEPKPVITVREAYELLQMLNEDEWEEVDIHCIIGNIGNVKTVNAGGRIKKMLPLRIVDKEENISLRAVAWGNTVNQFLSSEIRTGDEVIIRGAILKKRKVKIRDEEVILPSITLGAFSTVEKIGDTKSKISNLAPGMYVTVFGFAVSPPRIHVYEKNGEEHRMLSFNIADDTGKVRVIVWNEELIDYLSSISENTPVKVVGRVKEGLQGPEIHISRDGSIEINPQDFPLTTVPEVTIIEEEFKLPLIIDFAEIAPKMKFNLECIIEETEEVVSQKENAPKAVAIVSDGKLRAKLLIWNDEIAKKISSLIGKKVRFINVTTPKQFTDEIVIYVGSKSRIELAEEIKEERKEIVEEAYEKEVETRIESIKEGTVALLAIVKDVIGIDLERRCRLCGSKMIVIEDTEICERGHMNSGIDCVVARILVDDGKNTIEAEIFSDVLIKILGIESAATTDLIKSKEDILEKLRRKLVGLPKVIVGEIRLSNGEKILKVIEIKSPDSKTLAKKIVKNLL